ncbi:penicillin-binding protein 2 [Natronosporangium hydrolyticum]|uniref:Penicillin-binding protein 2 n=1 Tax=Natronosporangium hydrolyticum TaxID=2811111 RepID=A0A895YNR0_9ACTN|nr:penicillin-binding protein 2 [Natronosporangium hydrolyticum]QSB16346.1 penicillin-binding protein 2 [Natronosporangium hydrolyticum]
MSKRRSDSRLGEARAYHPRGRTVRDQQSAGRAGRTGDPYRSVLQVFAEPAEVTRQREEAGERKGSASNDSAGKSGGPAKSSGQAKTGGPAKSAGAAKPGGPAKPARRGGSPVRSKPGGKPASRSKPGAGGKGSKPAPRRGGQRGRSGPPRLANSKQRLRLATALAMVMFSLIGLRLVEMQLTDGPAYAASGLENRLQKVTLPASRGAIYDREGNVLAISTEARYVFADPSMVDDPEYTAEVLRPLLGIPASELAQRLTPEPGEDGTVSRFEWLARGIEVARAEEIMALNLPGIGTGQDEQRIVPGHDLGANLIGFTGTDLTGLEGLEAAYDEVLRGVDGEREYEGGAGVSSGRQIPGGYLTETPPKPGSDLRLTIDMDLQYEAQRILADQLRAVDASFGAAVVLDPRSGEVLAQASYPTYNAADPQSVPPEERVDAATATVFDPGSTHKPLVFGAALEEGVIAPGDTLVVDPSTTRGDQSFQDTYPHAHGTELTLPAVMAFSSNVGTIQVADDLGSDQLYAYQQAFGLGQPTGVGMPGEAAGALLPPSDWYGSSYGSVPIGHSVDVTTLQLAAAYGAIANDGVWVQPRLVQSVVAPDGSETVTGDPESRRVLSDDNAAYVRELLEAVVTVPNGTGVTAAVPDYRVGGKTGTGKVVEEGEYADGDVATFVGMAPIDHPRYVIAVVAHTPNGGGGAVAAPAFQEMMGFTLKHYRVPPAATEPPTFELYP